MDFQNGALLTKKALVADFFTAKRPWWPTCVCVERANVRPVTHSARSSQALISRHATAQT